MLLYLDPRRTWLVQVRQDAKQFHTHAGIIDMSAVVGRRLGDTIETTLGLRISILKPVTLDYIMKSERRTQIVYPKDFSYIVSRSGIRNGSKVIECGTGSGALTTYFASIVSPGGYVHTFEARKDFYDIARKNVDRAGFTRYVKFENESLTGATASIPENNYDLALLDTGDPWLLLETAHRALKGSAFVFCVCPTTNQLETVVETMKDGLYCDVESVEIILRHMEARGGKTRPSMRMIGHTCYIASGRKIYDGRRAEASGVTASEDVENIKSP